MRAQRWAFNTGDTQRQGSAPFTRWHPSTTAQLSTGNPLLPVSACPQRRKRAGSQAMATRRVQDWPLGHADLVVGDMRPILCGLDGRPSLQSRHVALKGTGEEPSSQLFEGLRQGVHGRETARANPEGRCEEGASGPQAVGSLWLPSMHPWERMRLSGAGQFASSLDRHFRHLPPCMLLLGGACREMVDDDGEGCFFLLDCF